MIAPDTPNRVGEQEPHHADVLYERALVAEQARDRAVEERDEAISEVAGARAEAGPAIRRADRAVEALREIDPDQLHQIAQRLGILGGNYSRDKYAIYHAEKVIRSILQEREPDGTV